MQASDTYHYQPELDSQFPYTSWDLIVSYTMVRGSDDQVAEVIIDGLDGATVWCGKHGAPVLLEPEYRREVLRWLAGELERTKASGNGLWAELGEHCVNDWREQLSYAD